MNRVLVVDDERSVLKFIEVALGKSQLYDVVTAQTAEQAITCFNQQAPQVVVLDLHLTETHGFDLFHQLTSLDPRVPVIFITADGSSEVVIQAIRMGAFDYLRKPLNVDQLRQMVASAVAARKAADEPVALSISNSVSEEYFIGSSPAMLEVFKAIGRVSNQNEPVQIRGESGTGKELVARALVDHGNRSGKPFMSINCAAIPDALLESELFGHEKGSFTGADRRRMGRFEQCDGGTIFLDEIGDMSLLIQGKVLRILQQQTYERVGGSESIQTNVRIIAATHQPLEEMVESGRFRRDLLFRLNGYTIHLPPLRERPEDVPALTESFLRRAKIDMDRPELTGLTQDALDALMNYPWPGNVRELRSVVRQSLLNCVGTVITIDCLPKLLSDVHLDGRKTRLDTGHSLTKSPVSATYSEQELGQAIEKLIQYRIDNGSSNLYAEVVAEVERLMLAKILQITNGNQSRASELLGITRGKVRDRVVAFGIKAGYDPDCHLTPPRALEDSPISRERADPLHSQRHNLAD